MNSLRFGFITDTHYDYKYESRKDDTMETLIDKTNQCYQWFKEKDCAFVIHGGDVFDRHKIYNYDLMKNVRNTLKKYDLTTYFIIGQHDAMGYNQKTISKSNLGFLSDISDGTLSLIKDRLETENFIFYASHVDEDSVEKINSIGKELKPVVCVCHSLLTDKREAFGTISITHCKNENVQLVLSGDLHDGVPFQECNGIQFYNPGALARTEKCNRLPKVGVLTWNGKRFDIEEFYPKCPKAEDIFFNDNEIITASVNKEVNADEFIQSFKSFHATSKNAYELLLQIGKERKINPEILELIKIYKDKKEK